MDRKEGEVFIIHSSFLVIGANIVALQSHNAYMGKLPTAV